MARFPFSSIVEYNDTKLTTEIPTMKKKHAVINTAIIPPAINELRIVLITPRINLRPLTVTPDTKVTASFFSEPLSFL